MKITFISNYINHHQIPFSEAMVKRLGDDYFFIQTEPMEEERVRMGWAVDIRKIPYVYCYYENKEFCDTLLLESDIVICGGTEDELGRAGSLPGTRTSQVRKRICPGAGGRGEDLSFGRELQLGESDQWKIPKQAKSKSVSGISGGLDYPVRS